MKKKIFLLCFFFIISIFGNLKEEMKERRHIYTLVESEIKESKNHFKINYIIHRIQMKNNVEKQISARPIPSSIPVVIKFSYPPISEFNQTEKIFISRDRIFLSYTILQRYPNRVLLI